MLDYMLTRPKDAPIWGDLRAIREGWWKQRPLPVFLNHVYFGREEVVDEESGEVVDPGMDPLMEVPEEWPMPPGLTTRHASLNACSGSLKCSKAS